MFLLNLYTRAATPQYVPSLLPLMVQAIQLPGELVCLDAWLETDKILSYSWNVHLLSCYHLAALLIEPGAGAVSCRKEWQYLQLCLWSQTKGLDLADANLQGHA